jgi:hypothetical protein
VRRVTFAGTISVTDGPSVTINQPLDIEVCELARITLAQGTSQTVSFGGAPNAGLQFLSVTASDPGLRYAVNGQVDDAESPTLDYPLVLIGQNMIEKLAAAPLASLSVKNPLDHSVVFNIIAGRPADGS